ncbi:isocitrate lyase/PEP mutase family protein [Bacillus sp. B15-48]|uniref:isocitrate lyase/PEP mutase family protein n=1 Tax=Bacillus sp. B15-48 TaxID=1548601 RepID=UPI00193FA6E4|nr:isocitrate lyase/PEP mutase family protein [Bacillus sp. B15-48]
MKSRKKKTTRLKEIFNSPKTELMPFGVLPIHAQMAERAGFESFHISGGMSSWWLGGVPDVGLMTRTEVINNARRIVQSVDIPVYCDADTGYGGIQNVQLTVKEFIDAGIAGIHIEDQLDPKKAGGQAGIAIVSDEEAIGRLRCACDTRDGIDPDFVITARTDGYAVGGVEEALRRGKLYRKETNVDVIFYEGIRSWEEVEYLLRETPGPAYCIASRHAGRTPSVEELTRMGQAINIVPFLQPGVQDAWKLLLKVKKSGELAPYDEYMEECFALEGTEEFVGYGDIFVKPSYEDVRKTEEKYLPENMRRDYEGTIHD